MSTPRQHVPTPSQFTASLWLTPLNIQKVSAELNEDPRLSQKPPGLHSTTTIASDATNSLASSTGDVSTTTYITSPLFSVSTREHSYEQRLRPESGSNSCRCTTGARSAELAKQQTNSATTCRNSNQGQAPSNILTRDEPFASANNGTKSFP